MLSAADLVLIRRTAGAKRISAVWPGLRLWLAGAGLLAPALAVGLFTLLRFPPAFVDEAWNANRAWGLLHTGRAFGSMDSGVVERYDGYSTFMPWLGTAVHAAFVWLVGPSLLAVRLASFAFGLSLLGAVYTIGSRLGGRRAGLLAALLLSMSPAFLTSSHLARHDIMAAALGFGAVALYVTDRSAGFSLSSVLSGLAVGLTLDIHPNGLIYGPAIAALHLHDHHWSVPSLMRASRFWGFVGGVCAGAAFYAATHVLPYPQTFLALSRLGPAPERVPPLLTLDPRVWLRSLAETARLVLVLFDPLATLLAIPAGVILWRRRLIRHSRPIVLLVALSLTFAAAIQSKSGFYAILVTPAADLLAAVFVSDLIESLLQRARSASGSQRAPAAGWRGASWSHLRVVLGAALAFALVQFARSPSFKGLDDPASDYRTTLDHVARVIPPGSSVIGPPTYWFGLPPEQPYLPWAQLVYYRRAVARSTLAEAFRALRPEFLVLDARADRAITDGEMQWAGDHGRAYLSKAEVDSFLETQGHLVSAIYTQTFGSVRIYKIDWN